MQGMLGGRKLIGHPKWAMMKFFIDEKQSQTGLQDMFTILDFQFGREREAKVTWENTKDLQIS